MLTKISVYGLFNEIDYEIGLKSGPITYIHAQNGFGKSTVMKLVYNLLNGNLEDIRTVPFDKMELDFGSNSSLTVENRNEELTVLMQKNGSMEEISQNDLAEVQKTTYIDPERLYIFDDDGSISPAVEVYMKDLSESIAKAIRDCELKPAENDGGKYTDSDLDTMFKNIEAKLNFIRQAGFEPSIPSGIRFPPSRYEIGENREKYKSLALSLKAYVDKYYELAESIVVFKDIVNELFVNKSIEINNKGYLQARMDRSGTILPISKFSSGEKQVLIIFYLLLFKTSPGSLVIIDEPEVSLHVSWQQKIGKFVKDIARVRGIQAIISTHAPAIIHEDWDLAVELGESRTN